LALLFIKTLYYKKDVTMELELGDLLGEQDTAEKVTSQFHTLYVEEASDTLMIDLSEEDAARVGTDKLEVETKPHKAFTLYTSAYMHDTNDLVGIMHALRASTDPADTLDIFIDSPGGMVKELIKIFTLTRGLFADKTTTILDPEGSSCGALLFCVGDTRIIPEFGHLMFHNYSTGAGGKGQEVMADVNFSDPHIKSIFRNLMVKPGYFNEEEFIDLTKGVDFYFDAYEACVRGCATHVMVGEYLVEAEDFVGMRDGGFSGMEEYQEWMEALAEEEVKELFGDYINEDGEIEITPELLAELGGLEDE
jgi:ATP-dependent protease ClpP protease subunit